MHKTSSKVELGSEHPLCDSIQLVLLILYFAVWGIDNIGYFAFGISTVLVGFTSYPLLLLPAALLWGFGIYLVLKSHEAVFGETTGQPRLNDLGVYSWVRHPMYLGTLVFCLGFIFIMPSLLSFGVWITFFIFYDKMATYEEKDLIRLLGEEYIEYQKRVPKWFPRIRSGLYLENKLG
ncbi:MAG: isoprenylcysteine carboxylmethyltransferase family protein [Candidatus Bathyarchaeota archaeon]|nr:MAG: isoprenylcysteine carboxylmethyltransferase family protein [Candidatus Bathyarchaeota archaeon]